MDDLERCVFRKAELAADLFRDLDDGLLSNGELRRRVSQWMDDYRAAHAAHVAAGESLIRGQRRERGSVRLALLGLLAPVALSVQLLTPGERVALETADGCRGLDCAAGVEWASCDAGNWPDRVVNVPLACYVAADPGCDAGYEDDCPIDPECLAAVCSGAIAEGN